jgi:hypothetical protein
MASEKVGHGPCPQKHCNAEAFFSRSAGGKLKYTCTHCDSSGYCEEGGSAFHSQMAGVKKPNAAFAAAPAAAPAPTKKQASGLLMG